MTTNTALTEKIIVARIGLLIRHPFFGNMATRLKFVDASDKIETAATDGRHIYYNAAFFDKMSVKEIEFVIAHEILHNVFDHMGRVNGRIPEIWNIAADYTVNGQLVRDRIGTPPKGIKIFESSTHYGKSAEEIYEELLDKSKDALKKLGKLLDEHMDCSEESNQPGKGIPKYSKDELKQIRDEVRDAMLQAAQAAGAGNTPAMIKRMINELSDSKMSWRQILRQQVQSTIKHDYTFMRPNRKGWHMNAVLPGMNYDETIDIVVALDMSGSISNAQANDFLSEIRGIMDEYRDFKVKVMCFDTRVYNEQDFYGQGGDDISSYVPEGGGGTSFECVWDYLKQNEIVPKKLLMFTDMYPCGTWGDAEYCDTIFIGHGTTTIVAPFGETVYYDAAK